MARFTLYAASDPQTFDNRCVIVCARSYLASAADEEDLREESKPCSGALKKVRIKRERDKQLLAPRVLTTTFWAKKEGIMGTETKGRRVHSWNRGALVFQLMVLGASACLVSFPSLAAAQLIVVNR
jgi:hypothetical protein